LSCGFPGILPVAKFKKKEVNALENDLFLGRVQVLLAGGRVDARGSESTHEKLRTMGYVENNRRDVYSTVYIRRTDPGDEKGEDRTTLSARLEHLITLSSAVRP
jgi:hypothetical protein